MQERTSKEKRRDQAERTKIVRAFVAEGVLKYNRSAMDGYLVNLVGNGQIRMTGARHWEKVMQKWRESTDPPVGWRACSFRDYVSGQACVMLTAVSLGRILAEMERLEREVGRDAEVGD